MFLLVSRIPSICMEVGTELYFRQTDELFSSDFWIFVLYHMKKGVKMATTQVKVTSWSPTYMPRVRYRVIFQTDSWAGLFRILKFFLYYIKKGVEMATTQVKVTSWSPTQWYVTWFYHHPFFCQFDCVIKIGELYCFPVFEKNDLNMRLWVSFLKKKYLCFCVSRQRKNFSPEQPEFFLSF